MNRTVMLTAVSALETRRRKLCKCETQLLQELLFCLIISESSRHLTTSDEKHNLPNVGSNPTTDTGTCSLQSFMSLLAVSALCVAV